MEELLYNPEKKYPIKAYQLITERFECKYCNRTNLIESDVSTVQYNNTQKCAVCGTGSQTFWLGMILGLVEEIKAPIALIERVNCKHATKEAILKEKKDAEIAKKTDETLTKNLRFKEYQVIGDTVYHCINVSSAASKGIANSQCYDARDDTSFLIKCGNDTSSLDDWCRRIDIEKAAKVFENSKILEPEANNSIIRYWHDICEVSGLHEFYIPIYSGINSDGTYNDIVGVLIIGQLAIGDTMPNLPIPDEVDQSRIIKLRVEGWKKACSRTSNRQFKDVDMVFDKYGKSIMTFITHTLNRLEIRVTDFLHNYQAYLLDIFNDRISQLSEPNNSDEYSSELVKSAIRDVFMKIKEDFAIKQIFLFFPDMDLLDDIYEPILKGEIITTDNDVICKFNTTHFKQHSSKRIKNMEDYLSFEGDIISSNCEFYASAKGKDREKVVFGVLIEWSEVPEQRGVLAHLHESLFNAFVGICVGEIAACVSLAYSISQKAFAEETRHDLAHRLQTLEAHNYIFNNAINNFENSNKNNDDCIDFIRQCNTVKNSNNDLHSTLTFLCDTLDKDNLDYDFQPEPFNPYHQIFPQLKNLYNASTKINEKNQYLNISASPSHGSLIYADERMFKRIMNNLLDNAFKYGYPNTNIIIETEISNDGLWYVIKVSNFCEGINNNFKEDMYKRGTRTESISEGKGLGLFVAKDFTLKNNGKLDLTSGIIVNNNTNDNGFLFNINFTCRSEMWREIDKDSSKDNEFRKVYDEIKSLYIKQYKRSCTEIGVGEKIFRSVLDAIIANKRSEKNISQFDEAQGKDEDLRYTQEQLIRMARKPIYIVTFTLQMPTYKNR